LVFVLQVLPTFPPLFPTLSNKQAVSLSAAICASPFSHSWLIVGIKLLLIGLSLEKCRCSKATEIGSSRMLSATVTFGNIFSIFSQDRTPILAVSFVLISIKNYAENNRTLVHLLIPFT